jgi:putative endonuclease
MVYCCHREERNAGNYHPEQRTEMKKPAVYIIANNKNGTIYTGVTSNLIQRIYQHKQGLIEGFTQKYDCKILVFYEIQSSMESAIIREKQIKSGSRDKKLKLIEEVNPCWRDLYEDII